MLSSVFFRAHWSRHLCFKKHQSTGKLKYRQREFHQMKCIHFYCDISPSLADPALLSVVRVVDGQVSWFYHERKKKFIYRASYLIRVHWYRLETGTDQYFQQQSTLVQASLLLKHQPTGQLERTRLLTSYP